MSTAADRSYGPESVPEYATHLKCGSIVELCEVDGESTFSVYCPECRDHVLVGELSDDEGDTPYYIVRAPR